MPTKPKARSITSFTVSYGGMRIKVRVLPTMRDVHREYIDGLPRRRDGKTVQAFFAPANAPSAKHGGTIVLPFDGRLEELIPHEVVHAVMHKIGGAHCFDDEKLATSVGILSARITRKIKMRVVYG